MKDYRTVYERMDARRKEKMEEAARLDAALSAKEKEIHIKKFNYKPILISACSILLVSSVIVILESDLLKHPMSGTVEIILPKKIKLFGNEYYSTDELIDYEDYSFNLVGYIIEEDDVDSYINEFPNIDYYVVGALPCFR